MKEKIHPTWFAEANVICACGNTWKTGATQAEIRTDICSACHPFYTGEQRIVDTEGQVDRFIKRLQNRDNKRAAAEERAAARTSPSLSLSELGLEKRYVTILADNEIKVVGDFLARLQEGEDTLLAIPGIGRKVLADAKKALRNRGYELPVQPAAPAAETEAAE